MISINLFWLLLSLSALGIIIIIFIYHNLLKTSRKETDTLIEAIEDYPGTWIDQWKNLNRIIKKIKGDRK